MYNIDLGNPEITPIITLDIAKKNSSIEHAANDDLLQILLDAAIEDAEAYTGISIFERKTVVVTYDSWAEICEDLPVVPVKAITSIKYWDESGVEITVDAGKYRLVNAGSPIDQFISFDWPSLEITPSLDPDKVFPITLAVETGFVAAAIPKKIVSAILMRFSHKELYREDMPTSVNRTFEAALRHYKKW